MLNSQYLRRSLSSGLQINITSKFIHEVVCDKSNDFGFVPDKDLDQPGLSHCLNRVFAMPLIGSSRPKLSSC